jgi:hypothetical protein
VASALSVLVASLPSLLLVLVGGALALVGAIYSTHRTTAAVRVPTKWPTHSGVMAHPRSEAAERPT